MEEYLHYIVPIVLLVIWEVYQWLCDRKRRQLFQHWADFYQWKYCYRHNRELYESYSFLEKLCQGSNRYAFDFIYGKWQGFNIEAFNFHYETYSGDKNRTTHHHYLGVILINLTGKYSNIVCAPPALIVKFKTLLDKIITFPKSGSVKLDSVEFNRNYLVISRDKRIAYDFCHLRMMKYLLDKKDIDIELNNYTLAIYHEGIMKPERFENNLNKLCEIKKLIPKYLYHD